jgi:hypothetical protein
MTLSSFHTEACSEKLSRAFSNGKLWQAKDSQLLTWHNYKLNIVFQLRIMVLEFISALNWISVIVPFFYSHCPRFINPLSNRTSADWRKFLSFQAKWLHCVPQGLKLRNSTLYPLTVYMFYIDFRINSDYFPLQY